MNVHGFLLALTIAAPAAAQSVGHDLENGFKDVLHVWTAPGRLDANSAKYLGATALGTGVLMLIDQPVYRWIQDHPDSWLLVPFRPFREGAHLSSSGRTFLLIAGGLGMYAAGWAADSRDLRQAGMGCASAAAAATVGRGVVNHIIGRTRPRFERGAFQFELFHNDWNKRSFFGGHAAHVMACVSLWNNQFDLGLAEPVLYALAGGVGWARVLDGAHWPSDTFVGQVYGYAIGNGIADRYAQRNQPPQPAAAQVPALGIRVSIRF